MLKFLKITPSIRSLVNLTRSTMRRVELNGVSLRFSSTSYKAEAIDGCRAAHCMFWARTQSTAIGNMPMKALIMMQVNKILGFFTPVYFVNGFMVIKNDALLGSF